MQKQLRNNEQYDRVREEAVQWLIQLDESSNDPHLEQELNNWLLEDGCHAELFQQVQMIWLATGTVQVAARKKPSMWTPLLGLVLAVAVFWGYMSMPDVSAGKGMVRQLVLEDGTEMVLAAGTAVDIELTDDERRIRLRKGAIYVKVADSPRKLPFVIEHRVGEAQALGTAFSVEQLGDALHVGVYESAVRITPRDNQEIAQTLLAGESAMLTRNAVNSSILQVVGEAPGWLKQQLVFTDVTLAQVLEQLQRYERRKQWVQLSAEQLNRSFSGVLNVAEIQQAYDTLALAMGLEFDRSLPLVVLIREI